MEINKNITVILVTTLVLVLTGCNSESNSNNVKRQLEGRVADRISILENSFRHKLLSYDGATITINEIEELFDGLSTKTEIGKINSEMLAIFKGLNVNPIKLTAQDDIELSILLNKLLILDELIFQSQVSSTFGSLKATVFVNRESIEEVEYYIGISAYDERFNPEVELFSKCDTFNINVNEDGFGYYTIKKRKADEKYSFSGDVIVYSSNGDRKRLPFKFEKK